MTEQTSTALEDLEQARRTTEAFGEGAHVVCDNLVRIYRREGVEVVALQGLDLLVERGELVAVIGASGSGKSTLLNILSGLDVPTAGLARVGGQSLLEMRPRDRLRYRRHVVGFVWQRTSRNLVPYLTGAENVALPMLATRTSARTRRERTAELLELLRVTDCADRRPEQLAGGEQQRVAIAVALANQPELLLADEPTGSLDTLNSDEIIEMLADLPARFGTSVVLVTHEPRFASYADRVVFLRDGLIVDETRVTAPDSPAELIDAGK